jgi:hypothetical protein
MFECLKVGSDGESASAFSMREITTQIGSRALACVQVNAMPPPPPAGKCYVMPFPVKVSLVVSARGVLSCCAYLVGHAAAGGGRGSSGKFTFRACAVRTPSHVRGRTDPGQPTARKGRLCAPQEGRC